MTQVAYKFRFYPTLEQKAQLAKEFGCSRFIYNHCLDMRLKAYRRRGENLNYVKLSKHIKQLKSTTKYHWLKDVTASVLTQKLIDQDKAFKNFFNHGFGFPKFKSKLHAQSIRYQLDQRIVHSNYRSGKLLKLPKLGELKIKWSKRPQGVPKMVTVSKTACGKYYISFMCVEDVEVLPKTGQTVGIDVGVKDVCVTSDGYQSGAPKYTYKYQRKLKLASRALSRKTKGSKRWHKQRCYVASIHTKIKYSRRDFLHKETSNLIGEYDLICIEDLNVSGMVKNRKLSKAVSDVGMYEFKRQLLYKADWYGKEVQIISRWEPTTKTCSACQKKHEMALKDRVMTCDCGLTIDRDINAAINVKKAGEVLRGAAYPLAVS